MKKSVQPSKIKGTVAAPSSKSMLQRAIAAGLLSKTPLRICNATLSNDALAAIRVVKGLGAEVEIKGKEIFMKGGLKPTGEVLNCGEAGLSIRMFSPIAALWHEPITLTGEGGLLVRPVCMIEQPLRDLGVKVSTTKDCPPLTVKGPLQGGETVVDGSVSSQFLTGLLMALPLASKDSRLKVRNLKSKPYIDMTLRLLEDFGVRVEHTNYETFIIKGNQEYALDSFCAEGDWSGAAFLLVAGAIGGSVKVTGLSQDSPQADRRILDVLEAVGAEVKITDEAIIINREELKAFDFDATHCPDLFPPLVALACNCKGISTIEGVERLTFKESNRAVALENEFSALGGVISVVGNRMEIDGGPLKGGIFNSYGDHRIAMAGALAAINASGAVTIDGYECAAKSYPDFFSDLIKIGGIVDE